MKKSKIALISIVICCSIMAVGNIGFSRKMWLPISAGAPTSVKIGEYCAITHQKGFGYSEYELDLFLYSGSGVDEGSYFAFIYGMEDGNSAWLNGTTYIDSNFTSIDNAEIIATGVDYSTSSGVMKAHSSGILLNNSVTDGDGKFQAVFSTTLSNYNSSWSYFNDSDNILSTTTSANINIDYNLFPTIIIDSEHFDEDNTYAQIWDKETVSWVEYDIDSIILHNPYYRLRIYDRATDYLVYEDGSEVLYSKSRTISITTLKMTNYSGEPVTFHISNSTTTYQNATYWNSPDLVTMFSGTKNSSDYTNLDYSDFDSLLLEPVGTPSGGTAPVTVDFYPENSAFVNGTVDVEDYDYFTIDDFDYFTIFPYTATSQVDYIWSTEYYYPTGSSYTYGSSSSSYSNLDSDDNQYYSILSDSSSQVADYIWALEHIYPTDGYATNGTTSSLYSYMEEDDLDYFVWLANSESVLNGDFEWAFEKWYATSSYYTYGSSADSLSNLEIDDELLYTIVSDSDSTQVDYVWALENIYPTSGVFTNGSTSSLYSYMEEDDLNYFISIANSESVLNGDFEWAFEDWYADNSAWVNGTASGLYSYMETQDSNYYTIASNSEGTASSFSSAEEEWYAINSAFINGSGENPYSYMELDDNNYWNAIANTEKSSAVDYVWYNGDWYPLSSSYTNGSSSDPYSNLNTDDTNYYIIESNSEGTVVDYVWWNDDWYPTSSSYINGSSSDSYSNMDADDSTYYIVECNSEGTEVDWVWYNGDWNPLSATYVNGSSADPYTDLDTIDTNYYTISCNSEEGEISDYIWFNGDWYPTTSYYVTGSSLSPYNYLELDDDNYYVITSEDDGGTQVDYIWHNGDWYPTNAVYTSGTTSSIYTDLELDDDTNIFIVESEDDGGTIVDYIWHNGDWYPLTSSFVNGSSTSLYSSLNTDDENFYEILANMESTLNGDYVWSWEDFYPDASSYVNGTSVSPYSFLDTDDTNYYLITPNSEGSQFDYVWMYNAWYPLASSYINGSSADPYSYLDTDDTNYYTIVSNSEFSGGGGYTSVEEIWYANTTTHLNGTGTGTLPDDIDTKDITNFYEADCNSEYSPQIWDYWETPNSIVETNGTYTGALTNLDYDDGDNVEFICNSEYHGGSGSEYLSTNAWDGTYDNWWTHGTNALFSDDTTYLYEKRNEGVTDGWWDFPSTTGTGTLTVTVSILGEGDDGDDGVNVYVDTTGGAGTNEGSIIFTSTGTMQYETLAIGTYTVAEVNAMRIYLETTNTNIDDINLDHLRLYVEWNTPSSEYHALDEQVIFDYSELGEAQDGNLTSRIQITDITLDYRFYSNVSQEISIYAWDFTGGEWDILTSTSPTTETAYQNTSLDYHYFNVAIPYNLIQFKLRIVGSSSTAGFKAIFDQIKLEIEYENQGEVTWWHNVDFYYEFDIGYLLDIGNMTSKSDITDTYLTYTQATNLSTPLLDVYYYFWNYQLSQWDVQSYDSEAIVWQDRYDDSSTLDNLDYWSTDLKCRLRLVTTWNNDEDSGVSLRHDLVTLNVTYDNHNEGSGGYYHYIDGYIEFDMSSLSPSNITSRADFMSNALDYLWQTNVSNPVTWYLYDWDATQWDSINVDDTQTTFALDEYVVTNEYIHTTLYTTRLRFVTELENAVDSGVSIEIDLAELGTWYENHQTPTYNYYHEIDGYLEIDMSLLDTNGNITSISDFVGTNFQWIWQTNISNSVSFYAYDWTDIEWDLIITDTQTTFDTDTSQIFDDTSRYIHNTNYVSHFRFVSSYEQSNTTDAMSGVSIELDLVNLTVGYHNHQHPTYDNFHYIDGYLEFDMSGLESGGQITSRDDFMESTLNYLWRTNVSNPVTFYAYDWDGAGWDVIDVDTQTAFALDTNTTTFDDVKYIHSTSYISRFRFTTEYTETNVTSNSSIQLDFDLLELNLWYENHLDPTYDFVHTIDAYFEIDISSLQGSGNITSINDIMATYFDFEWQTNVSNSVDFYAYNFQTTNWELILTDTQTTWGVDSNATSYDSTDNWDGATYKARFKFYTQYTQENETTPDGIQIEFDYVNLNLWYENHLDPTYDFIHEIDGTLVFNMSSLQTDGNITAVADFMATHLEWIWLTNISNSVSYYAYDWISLEWDLILTDTQTSEGLDTSEIYDDVTRYINSSYCADFRFYTEYTQENETSPDGIQIEIEFLELNLWYENQHMPVHNWYHYIDGYFTMDMSALEVAGNILSRDDFMQSTFEYRWQTNISNSVSFYAYNWDTTDWDLMDTDTQTAFATDTNTTTFDSTAYFDSVTYTARFRFVTEYKEDNSTSPDGINLEFDYVNLNLWYENHLDPTFDWYHYIDGYVDIDMSSLQVGGNITSINDFMTSYFQWDWKTNVSNSVSFWAYDWTDLEWDLIITDTQVADATDTSQIFDDFSRYIHNSNYNARFRFTTEFTQDNSTSSDGIQLELDLVELNLSYENHLDPCYDWYHEIDGYLEIDISGLQGSGNITSINDIMQTSFQWIWQTNISQSVSFYAYNFQLTQWDLMLTDTQTTFGTDNNDTAYDSTDYWDGATYKSRFRFVTSHTQENETDSSGIQLELDFVELNLWYENHLDPTFDWYHFVEGYIEWDISDLYSTGNITSRDDITDSYLQYLWQTNESSAVSFYAYDWDGAGWDIIDTDTQTSFALDTNATTYDELKYYNATDYLIRFKFVTNYIDTNTTINSSIQLDFDYVCLNITYTNHNGVGGNFDWYHYIDGYIEWDLSDLDTNGNITSRDAFMESTFTYRWRTNVSESVLFYAYDWDDTEWDVIDEDTQTVLTTDTNSTTFDDVRYINPTTYLVRFRMVTEYIVLGTPTSSGIEIDLDLVEISFAYENQHLPTYDNYHFLDAYLEMDISDLYTNGNMTSDADIMGATFDYLWQTNVSNEVTFYAYDWVGTDWDIMDADTQTAFALDTNTTTYHQDKYYDDTTHIARFRYVTDYIETNQTSNSSIQLEFDMVELSIWYENHQLPTYDWTHDIDGYLEFNLTSLFDNGNMTAFSDIVNTDFAWEWQTNISEAVTFYAYDFQLSEWVLMLSDTQTTFDFDSNATTFDSNDFFNATDKTARFRFNTTYSYDNSTVDTGINLQLDYVEMNVTYHNHLLPTYDNYHYLDCYIEFDLTYLDTNGNITSESDIMGSSFEWLWRTNVSNEVSFFAYDWDGTDWEIMLSDTQTSFQTDTNDTTFDDLKFYDNYKVRFKATTEYTETNVTTNSSIQLEYDLVKLSIWYENHHLPTYDWTHEIDGYLTIDLSVLDTNGNITSRDDFMNSNFEWLWFTNESNTVAFYAYNWTDTGWDIMLNDTQTVEASDTNSTTFDALDYYNPTTYIVRFRFHTIYYDDNTTVESGIQLDFDMVELTVSYENHHLPTYDFYHSIDGYVEFNISSLYDDGNISAREDITNTYFRNIWRTNVSNSVDFYAYDWDDTEWDYYDSDTQTTFQTDDNATLFDDHRYINPTTYLVRTRFETMYIDTNTTINDGIQIEFDFMQLNTTFESAVAGGYNFNLSAMIVWDYTGDINYNSDWDNVNHTSMVYEYYTDIEIDYLTIEFQYNNSANTTFHEGIYTTSTEISNLTQSKTYLNNTGDQIIMTINASYFGTSLIDNFDFFFEFANMSVYYLDYDNPTYDWDEMFSAQAMPYDSTIRNVTQTTDLGYNVTDVDDEYVVSTTPIPDFTIPNFAEINYTSTYATASERPCIIHLSDQNNNTLNFEDFKVYINGTRVFSNEFFREEGEFVNVSVYDRFDQYITSTVYEVVLNDNMINLQFTVYRLKIYNQQEVFAWFNLTLNPETDYYWSEWLAPMEISEFILISGAYMVNVTEYEENTSSMYYHTMTDDETLLISSNNNLATIIANIESLNTTLSIVEVAINDTQYMMVNLESNVYGNVTYLTQLVQYATFSELVDWTSARNDWIYLEEQIELYQFVNLYRDKAVLLEFYYHNDTEVILLDPSASIRHFLPSRLVSWKAIDYETNATLIAKTDLGDGDEPYVVGEFEDVLFFASSGFNIAIFIILIIIALIVAVWYFITTYRKRKAKKDKEQRERAIREREKSLNGYDVLMRMDKIDNPNQTQKGLKTIYDNGKPNGTKKPYNPYAKKKPYNPYAKPYYQKKSKVKAKKWG